MENLYSIGEFSKINRITTKTLRHYDKIGLLKPLKIDEWTGYRYYGAEQLSVIRHILKLRDMGFSLSEIGEFQNGKIELDEYLGHRQREIEASIEVENRRLAMVREYRERLEGEKLKNEIVIRALPTVTAAAMRTVVPGYDTYFDIVPKMGDYMKSVGAVCAEPAYCFTIYHDGEYKESDIDVEVCEAVVEAREESDKVKFKVVEGADQAACLMHRGPYSTLRESYNRLYDWIAAEGWEPVQPARESYIDGIWNRDDESDWLTEIQVPVAGKDA